MNEDVFLLINLPLGNTKVIAEKIQKQSGCDVFEIVPEKAYSGDYTKCTEVAQEELNQNVLLLIRVTSTSHGMTPFILAILSGEAYSQCVSTSPLRTTTALRWQDSPSLCLGSSIEDFRKLCLKAIVKDGVAIKGRTAKTADVN